MTQEHTFEHKIENNLLTLDDQEEALTHPGWAYEFTRYVKGADREKCREACKGTEWEF